MCESMSFLIFQAMASVIVASVSVRRIGRVRTATAQGALTLACPTWAYCAATGASVCAGPASAPSLVLMGPHVTSVPPARTPAP